MKKSVSVDVSVSAYELGQGVRQLIVDAKKALADGWQPGQDIPVVAMSAYQNLLSKMALFGQLKGDAQQDGADFYRAWAECGFDVAKDLSA